MVLEPGFQPPGDKPVAEASPTIPAVIVGGVLTCPEHMGAKVRTESATVLRCRKGHDLLPPPESQS